MIELLLTVLVIAFILQFIDASLGMGFGTMTPILLIFGYPPLQVIPAVILASAVLSLLAGIWHHSFGNIDFFEKKDFKITSTFILIGIFAVSIGAFVALSINELYLQIYVALLIITIGVILILKKGEHTFSWPRLLMFSLVASFNKGISGEGYGPVLASGQVFSGVSPKKAVAITALSEGVISFFGVATYFLYMGFDGINTPLIISLLFGGILASPLAAYFVKNTEHKNMKLLMASLSILSGVLLLGKLLFF